MQVASSPPDGSDPNSNAVQQNMKKEGAEILTRIEPEGHSKDQIQRYQNAVRMPQRRAQCDYSHIRMKPSSQLDLPS